MRAALLTQEEEIKNLFSGSITKIQQIADDAYIVTVGSHQSIVVRCPYCNRLGRLTVRKWHKVADRPSFRLVHEKRSNKGCNIPVLSDEYEAILRLWKSVKG